MCQRGGSWWRAVFGAVRSCAASERAGRGGADTQRPCAMGQGMHTAGRGTLLVAVTAGQRAGVLTAAPALPGTLPSLLQALRGAAWPGRTSPLLPAAGEGRGRRRGSCCVQFSFKYRLLSNFLHRKCRNTALGENRVFQAGQALDLRRSVRPASRVPVPCAARSAR